MARTGPRPHTRTGREAPCVHCGKPFWLHKSAERRGRKYCSHPCSTAARRALIYNDADQKRLCATCRVWKPYADFASWRGKGSGARSLQSNCRPCALALSYEWAAENPKRRRELNARYKPAPKKLTAEQRERKNELRRAWGKRNREKVRMWNKLRVHRQRAAGDTPHRYDMEAKLCYQDYRCVYCGAFFGDESIPRHLDHKTPVSRGGTNDYENLQWLCGPCNMKKGVMTHDEYLVKVGAAQ